MKAALQTQLNQDEFDAAYRAGQKLNFEEALALVLDVLDAIENEVADAGTSRSAM